MSADILTYPSCFMFETGSAVWEPLLRSRAIENQCYVIAAAQTGYTTPTRRAWGHAMVWTVILTGQFWANCVVDHSFLSVDSRPNWYNKRSMLGRWRNRCIYGRPWSCQESAVFHASHDAKTVRRLSTNGSNAIKKRRFVSIRSSYIKFQSCLLQKRFNDGVCE